jgi:hypothetical protein
MKASTLYRITSIILLVFAAGHTLGFLRFKPPTTEAAAVRDAMNDVHFQVQGRDLTYNSFYIGFGLSVTMYLLFSAFLAWHLAGLSSKDSKAIGNLGWAFFAVQLANLIVSAVYFFVVPTVFCVIVVGCLGLAAWRVRKA